MNVKDVMIGLGSIGIVAGLSYLAKKSESLSEDEDDDGGDRFLRRNPYTVLSPEDLQKRISSHFGYDAEPYEQIVLEGASSGGDVRSKLEDQALDMELQGDVLSSTFGGSALDALARQNVNGLWAQNRLARRPDGLYEEKYPFGQDLAQSPLTLADTLNLKVDVLREMVREGWIRPDNAAASFEASEDMNLAYMLDAFAKLPLETRKRILRSFAIVHVDPGDRYDTHGREVVPGGR